MWENEICYVWGRGECSPYLRRLRFRQQILKLLKLFEIYRKNILFLLDFSILFRVDKGIEINERLSKTDII